METVLIIDDETLLVNMYKTALEKSGYKVATSSDGKGGLSKIKEIKPDLVLLDIMMPEMTGLDVLDEIKKDKNVSQIPIVMLTNLTWNPDPNVPLSKGAVDVWVKAHIKPGDLVDKVKELFGSGTMKIDNQKPEA